MKNCVIFASYIPDKSNLYVGLQFLNYFKDNFKDYDIFVGVNPSCNEWIELLEQFKSELNITYKKVDNNLVVDSDASAYQAALSLLKNNDKQYNTVWFVHTKGVTSNCHNFRDAMFDVFLSKKNEIEYMFNNDNTLGGYYPFTGTCSSDTYISDYADKILKIKTTKIGPMVAQYSFYVIKGEIIKLFMENHIDGFFEKNLVRDMGHDRYFFESIFPILPLKFNYSVYKNPLLD
jgi:hypothetical protein